MLIFVSIVAALAALAASANAFGADTRDGFRAP
jgi:hypothetical protein